ncbi:hypothetical protein QYE76_006122 [Lolium multiflorum]|uniref:Uncharacterized protein n=1 Tax=Lolium multiflorum TaxID=4521 RepID=A0AAD8RVR9_LOLMU|nr:hypothetical protein QYE76_006122 [Lolium multiflorum]
MLNKVWGKPDEEMRELADLEDSLKDFFAKHKEVRQKKALLVNELSAKVKVLEAENESLEPSCKNPPDGSEARKELSEKHARDPWR